MSPPPPRREHHERGRGERPEREPIDPMQALERLYAKKVITLEEGQAAAKLIDANAVFPAPPRPAAAPASPASSTAPSVPMTPDAAEKGGAESSSSSNGGGPEAERVPPATDVAATERSPE